MRFILIIFLFIASLTANAQVKYTISGTVKDSSNGEALISAYINFPEAKLSCATNAYGFFSITLPAGNYTTRITYLGYSTKTISVSLVSDLTLNIELQENIIAMQEVTIQAEAPNKNVTSSEMSVQRLYIKEARSLPVIFGEQNIMATMQLLPGIKSAGEGNSGFYVRGGTADQNLVLLDEAPVYNTSHLLGFFSVFNSDAIKDVKLYKGGIPAEYGGHLSSVIDIRMNDGNSKKMSVSGGIGLISSRLSVEGPIVKDKGSFMISARRTYADLFLKLSADTNQNRSTLYFYDLNLKANYSLGNHDRIYLSGYFGRDVFSYGGRFGINWGNATSTLRWNHLFSNKLFLNSSFIFSNYNYTIALEGYNRQIDISSGIRDFNLKEDFQYYQNPKSTIKFGVNSTYHTFSPGSLRTRSDTLLNNRILPGKTALESGLYISHEYELNTLLTFNYGARLSLFSVMGPGTFYTYDSEGDKTDSAVYNTHSIVKNYVGFEPRLSLTYILNKKNSIKASYTRIYQYLHLLSNSTSGNPTDLWLPTSNNIKPQQADQWVLGYFKNLDNNNYETSMELYYKKMNNLIDYKSGADIILNPDVESQLLFGKGWAYGSEFYIKKKDGILTGWISYTLSRTFRQFDGIDQGNIFPAKQDRIHDISIVAIYKLSKSWTLASTWVFNTGDAVTFPSGLYVINGLKTPFYTERNGYRMPDYHRLDFSATNLKKLSNDRERSWSFSVYNVYARRNAYAINFRPDPVNPPQMQAVRLSLFSIIPSVTYNFKF